MKQTNFSGSMLTYFATAALFALSFTACNSSTEPVDSKEMAEEHNDAKFDSKSQERDADFLVKAAVVSLEEIKLGELAEQQAQKSDVKKLGTMTKDDHRAALNEMTSLAGDKVITIPTVASNETNEIYTKLQGKKGADFDKDYCDLIVKGHKEAIELFEKESTDGTDPEIKAWALKTLPVLRTHLDYAISCQNKL